MPFCTGCGARVEPGMVRCPACEARAAGARGCPRCGATLAGRESRFCIACGAPLASSEAAPATPAPAPAAPGPASAAAAPAPSAPAAGVKDLVVRSKQDRAAVYHRLGRLLITACYEGKLPYDRLPVELARQTQAGIESIRKGHAALAASGICPRCLERTLAGDPRKCARCGLPVPAGRANGPS